MDRKATGTRGQETVKLKITGTQYPAGGGEPVTTVQETEASFFRKGEACYWLYEEVIEGLAKPVRARIKHKGDVLELVRHSGNMVFDAKLPYRAEYRTPFGIMLLDIVTKSVERMDTADGYAEIKVCYLLENEGQAVGEYELYICGK
ncbi:MAG: DUF1934 domain-containing protein [Lachnospiraceae bacterium]|nr:DUF1934 domain-containing protein [Lachnospiraceae bacterium]